MSVRHGQDELLHLLGEEAFLALVDAFGGRRLYVAGRFPDDHPVARAIGPDAAARLSCRYAPDILRVPLAREHRARHYRAQGMSNGEIATKLGMTETGVEQLFRRTPKPPRKGSAVVKPIPLFPDL